MKKVYLVQRKHITVGLAEETEMAGIGATLDAAKGLAATQVLKWFRVDAPLEWESRTVLGGIKEWTSLCKIGRTGRAMVGYIITEEPVHEATQ